MKRNMDESMRETARLAGTGDLAAAKRLVRMLERAGRGERVLTEPLTAEEIGNDSIAAGLVRVTINEIADAGASEEGFTDLLLARLLGDISGNLAEYDAVDIIAGDVIIRVKADSIETETGEPCERCGATATTEIDDAMLCDRCFVEREDCDDECLAHASGCNGYCDHNDLSHFNECLADNERRVAQLQRDRRAQQRPR